MKDPAVLLEQLKKFRDERDWKQFHNPKDLALSMVLEAAEVLEHFQWKSAQEVERYGREHRDEIADEIADTLKYLLQLADSLGIEDIIDAALKKLEKDAKKYPVEKARGKHTKYTEL
jgi:NTP pyrophosphatase (non-canonical NTP hydrolase)